MDEHGEEKTKDSKQPDEENRQMMDESFSQETPEDTTTTEELFSSQDIQNNEYNLELLASACWNQHQEENSVCRSQNTAVNNLLLDEMTVKYVKREIRKVQRTEREKNRTMFARMHKIQKMRTSHLQKTTLKKHNADDKFDDNNNYKLPEFAAYKNSRDLMFSSEDHSSSDEKMSEDPSNYTEQTDYFTESCSEQIEAHDESSSEDIQSSESGNGLKKEPNQTQNPKKYKRMRMYYPEHTQTQESDNDEPKRDLETQKYKGSNSENEYTALEIMKHALSDSSDLDDQGCTSRVNKIVLKGYLTDESSSDERSS